MNTILSARHDDLDSIESALTAVPFDDQDRPLAVRARWGDVAKYVTFAIVRPDAMFRGIGPALLERLQSSGLHATHIRILRPHPRVIEEIYRHTQTRLMAMGSRPMWWLTPRYYALCPAAFLLLIGDDGLPEDDVTAALKVLKGPSNPVHGEPGQLRFDFDAQNIVMCIVHTSESANEAVREACLFFSPEEIGEAIEAALSLRRTGRTPDLSSSELEVGSIDADAHNFFSLLSSIQRRLLEAVDAPGAPEALAALEEAETIARGAIGYRQRAQLVEVAWQQAARVARDARGVDDDAVSLLRALSTPSLFFPILVDEVATSLRRYSVTLSRWDEVLLETGLAFHQLQIAGFSPNPK